MADIFEDNYSGIQVVTPVVQPLTLTPVWSLGGATITNSLTFERAGEYLIINGVTTFSGTATGSGNATLTFSEITLENNQSGSVRFEVQTTNLAFGLTGQVVSNAINFYTENTGSASIAYVGTDFGTSASGKVKTVVFKSFAVRVTTWIGSATQAYNGGLATSSKPGFVSYYEEYTHTSTMLPSGGGTASSAVSVLLRRVGKIVTMTFPGVTDVVPAGTTTSISFTTGFPAQFRPPVSLEISTRIRNNGSAQTTGFGLIQISTGGDIIIYRDASGTVAYTNAAQAGAQPFSASWAV